MTFTDGTILETNNIDGQNNLKTAVGVNDHSSEQEKFLYNEIWQIIDSYLRIRSTDSESDIIKNDKKLLLQFQEDFQKALSEYLNQIGKTFDIESMISNLTKENRHNDELIDEIKSLIRLSLQKMIRDKINGKVTNNVKIVEISEQLNNIKVAELKDKQIQKIIYETFDCNNKYIKEAKQEFCTKQEKYKEDLIKKFEDNFKLKFDAVRERYRIGLIESLNKNFMHDLQKVNYLNKQQETSPENKFSWKVDKTTVKYANIMVDSLILALNVGITKRIIDQTSKAMKFLVGTPVKIVKSVSKFIKSITKTIFSSVIGIVNNFILSPINFILTKSFNIIGGLTKTISKTLHFILESMKLKYLTVTPAGMYALGFLCGYIWTRLKSVIPELTFDIDGIMLLFTKLYGGVMSLFDIVKGWWDDFTIYHSGMIATIKQVFKNTSEFFSVLFSKDGGLKDALDKTKYGQSIKKIYDSITNSGWFKIVKFVFDGVIGLSKFIFDHPILFGSLYTASSLISSSKFLRKVPFVFGNIKGGIGNILIGTASSMATEAAMNGIFRMFGFEYDDEAVKFYDSERDRYLDNKSKFKEQYMQNRVSGLNEKDRKRYEFLVQYLDQEYNNIDDYYMLLKSVDKIVTNGDSNIKRLSDYMPNLVSLILENNTDTKSNNEYLDALHNNDIGRQISSLTKILGTKQKKLAQVQEQILSSNSSDALKSIVSQYVDKSCSIDSKRISLIQSKIEEYRKQLNGNKWNPLDHLDTTLKSNMDDVMSKILDDESLSYDQKIGVIKNLLNDYKYGTDLDDKHRAEVIEEVLRKHDFGQGGAGDYFKGRLFDDENYNSLIESSNVNKLASFFDGKPNPIHQKEIQLMIQNATVEQRQNLKDMLQNIKDPSKISEKDKKKMIEMRQEILGQYFEPYKKQILDSTTYLKCENKKNMDNIKKIKEENEKELNNMEQNKDLTIQENEKRNKYIEDNSRIQPNDNGVIS